MLLDSAIMPLVISGVPRVQSNLYDVCDFFVTTLVEDIDYIEEDKAVWLTPKLLSERIVRMFTEDDMDAFSGHSYEKAKEYLTKEVVHRWIELLK